MTDWPERLDAKYRRARRAGYLMIVLSEQDGDVRQAAILDAMSRRRSGSDRLSTPRSVASRVSQVRFSINWQWTAIRLQYDRLMTRSRLSTELMPYEHMKIVADMDFLVIILRRFLRTAEQARQIPSGCQSQLRLATKVFYSRWGNLTDIRNALEHPDTTAMFPVPAVSFPMHEDSGSQFVFMWPGGNLDLGKLFDDAQTILKAILGVIEPLEAERDTVPHRS
jgi:hypothetical protein